MRLTRNAPRVLGRLSFLVRDYQAERAKLSLAALRVLGPDVALAMPEFVRMMKQGNVEVALRALQVVDSAGKAGVPVLLDVLTNRQAYANVYYLEVRWVIWGADGRFAVPALVSCLTNRSWGVAVVAARWLGKIRMEPEVVVPALASCLEAPDARVRIAAVQALGEFRAYARAAMPSVVRELSDPDNGIRAAATNCLYMMERTSMVVGWSVTSGFGVGMEVFEF